MLTQHDQLDAKQLAELDVLCQECKAVDGNIIAIYRHLLDKKRPIPCNLLYYHKGRLVGFLSPFFFYEDTCEIALMVTPTSRRIGLAKKMMKAILPQIKIASIKFLLYSTPSGLNASWLKEMGFYYHGSEYRMQRLSSEPLPTLDKTLTIRPATVEDIPIMCTMDAVCFTTPQPNMAMHLQQLLQDPSSSIVIAEKEGRPMGKAHIAWQEDGGRLTDIAVLPEFQRQGLGSTILAYCVNRCLSLGHSNVILDIETKNQQALKLYTRLGFIVSNAYDFWKIPIEMIANRAGYSSRIW